MNRFEVLFGVKHTQINPYCIIMPFLPRDILRLFKIKKFSRGMLYGCGLGDGFTLVHSGIGQTFTADAVLYLQETPCRNVILFGSCGLVNKDTGLGIGDLVFPYQSYAKESFSELLQVHAGEPKIIAPRESLYEDLLRLKRGSCFKKVTCATVASLKLEEKRMDLFIQEGIDVVDLECSAFFSAANYAKLKSLAIFYITDIIKTQPFYAGLKFTLKTKVTRAIQHAARILCEYIRENSRD